MSSETNKSATQQPFSLAPQHDEREAAGRGGTMNDEKDKSGAAQEALVVGAADGAAIAAVDAFENHLRATFRPLTRFPFHRHYHSLCHAARACQMRLLTRIVRKLRDIDREPGYHFGKLIATDFYFMLSQFRYFVFQRVELHNQIALLHKERVVFLLLLSNFRKQVKDGNLDIGVVRKADEALSGVESVFQCCRRSSSGNKQGGGIHGSNTTTIHD